MLTELWWETPLRLLLATMLSGLIGLEREAQERPAGLRTHILVGLGSCLFMMVSMEVAKSSETGLADPGRIAAGVVTGIGFLGAGTIWLRGDMVRGLTTAAGIWATAAIGLSVGLGGGGYLAGIVATVVVYATLTLLRAVEHRYFHRSGRRRITMLCTVTKDDGVAEAIVKVVTKQSVMLAALEVLADSRAGQNKIKFSLDVSSDLNQSQLVQEVSKVPFVQSVALS